MAALRCAWTVSCRGAPVLRRGLVSRSCQRESLTSESHCILKATIFRRSIHRAAAQLQPTKVPLSDEERRLLEKLGEPDQETRGYLSELYDEFDVGAEKRKLERQRKKAKDTAKSEEDPDGCINPASGSTQVVGRGGLSSMMSSRSFHTLVRRGYSTIHDDSGDSSDSLKPSMRRTKAKVQDEAEIIWDSQEKEDLGPSYTDYYPENQKTDNLQGMSIERGEEGVFDVDELVEILRDERLQDIAVIELPSKLPYADYLVVCTAMSARQSKAVTQFLKKLFKTKKRADDIPIKIEGLSCDEWKVLDMGNVVLHIFDAETREKYNLETLWTVGPDMDEMARGLTEDESIDILQEHMDFVRSLTSQEAVPASSG